MPRLVALLSSGTGAGLPGPLAVSSRDAPYCHVDPRRRPALGGLQPTCAWGPFRRRLMVVALVVAVRQFGLARREQLPRLRSGLRIRPCVHGEQGYAFADEPPKNDDLLVRCVEQATKKATVTLPETYRDASFGVRIELSP